MDKSLYTKCLGRRGFPCWCDVTGLVTGRSFNAYSDERKVFACSRLKLV